MGKQKELWEERYEVVVSPCDWFESPREGDNLTTMVCFHNRYIIGDEHNYKSGDFGGWSDMRASLVREHKPLLIEPLFMYDHSGITISTKPFSCPWDSGQIGWVFVTRKAVKNCMGWKRITKSRLDKLNDLLIEEVKTYDQYLRGEAYKYEIIDLKADPTDDPTVDSCCGYLTEESARDLGETYAKYLFNNP